MSEFSNRFRQLKEEHNLTLKDLSEKLNITVPNLSYYMKGREPSYDILIQIADYFEVTTDWLIGRTDARNTSQEALYTQIENSLDLKEKQKLTGKSKAYYLTCQNTLYITMQSLYTLFLFYEGSDSLSKYLSQQINMYIGVISNCIAYFNKMYVYTSKDNLLNLVKYGETCADVQKCLLLSTFYNYAKYISEHDEDIPPSDREPLKEIVNFLFDNFIERNPESEIEELFHQVNQFKLDTHTVSESKFTD